MQRSTFMMVALNSRFGFVFLCLSMDQDNCWCNAAPSWWWLSTRGRPGPSQRSLSRWSSSCPCMSLVTLWTKMFGVLEKWCNLIRAKRVVVKVTLPFLLIGMFILRRFYLANYNLRASKHWKLAKFFASKFSSLKGSEWIESTRNMK